ncbi:hypothetical protein SteCoe_10774 [Stentor coeruleus]|uniref:Uncharacterized protein n=1 Tax=Stentor coeruleus TaxID=5963 RepID=A0A1R2CER3_9CILI|nr:hypothetical protein SteCoe_10774 [Stentor coeruleus]
MEKKPKPQLRENYITYAAIYSLGCILTPITIYTSDTLFKRFCGFHSRMLGLKGRSPKAIFGMAVGLSIIYSSITLNLYYWGLLKIVGIKSIYDIEGIISDQFADENGGFGKEISNALDDLNTDNKEVSKIEKPNS